MFSYRKTAPVGVSRSTISHAVKDDAARPIRLVYTDESGKFVMDPEATAALKKVKGPVGVISVCGRARQGKSFILNQLLGRSSGFKVGPTHKPCTKGLWMWSSPISRTAPDGSKYHLVLLDTEGIDSYDQTGTYATQIFSLAVLLSSLFVYNQMGGIDEAALDRLSLVTEMTKRIHVKAEGGGETLPSELAQYSPGFLWLLRDFYLNLEEEGRRITPREYLEAALQPTSGNSKAVVAKNEIRESIRALFPERDCHTLVRPLNSEQELQRLDEIPIEKMRAEFRSGLEALTASIFLQARPKRMGQAVLTGPMLGALTQSYLDAINKGAVPTIATSWQSVEEGECRRAQDVAMEVYASSFDASTVPEEGPLNVAHEAAVKAAMAAFAEEALGAGSVRQQYEERTRAALSKRFQEHCGHVYAEAELQCSRSVGTMEAQLLQGARQPGATLASLFQVLDRLLGEYEGSSAGPSKWHHQAAFLRRSFGGAFLDLAQRQQEKSAAGLASSERQVAELKERVRVMEVGMEEGRRDAAAWRQRHAEALSDSRVFGERTQKERTEVAQRVASLEARLATAQEGSEKQQDKARAAEADWRRQRKELELSLQHLQEQLRQVSADSSRKGEVVERALKASEAKVEQITAELSAKATQLEQLQTVVQRQAEQQIILKGYRESAAHTKQELEDARTEVRRLQAMQLSSSESARMAQRLAQEAAKKHAELEDKLVAVRHERDAAEEARAAAERLVLESKAASAASGSLCKQKDEDLKREIELRSKLEMCVTSTSEQLAQTESRLLNALQEKEDAREMAEKDREAQKAEAAMQEKTLQEKLTVALQDVEALRAELAAAVQMAETPQRTTKKRSRDDEAEAVVHNSDEAVKPRHTRRKRNVGDIPTNGAPPPQTADDEPFFDVKEEDAGEVAAAVEAEEIDIEKLTKMELKRRITDMGFGHEVLAKRNPSKGDLVAIYKSHV